MLALAVLIALIVALGGCQRAATPSAAVAPADRPDAAAAAEQPRESGFSTDLGDRPSFTPRVAPYTVKANLSNVANLKLFTKELRPEHRAVLAKQGFVVVPADWKQMEFVYELNNYPREHRPSFVTADSMLHTYHIFYDYLLRTMEVTTLYERVSAMSVGLLQGAAAMHDSASEERLREAARLNYAFALTPVLLLQIPEAEWGVKPPDEVRKLAAAELAQIEAHQGWQKSPTAGFLVDYSQFIPRGHYTRSDKLKRYFKGMMWYGLVPLALRNLKGDLALTQARQAALMAQALLTGKAGQEPLTKVWEEVYDVTAFLVGYADDNTPQDFGKAMGQSFGERFDPMALLPEANLQKLAEGLLALRSPGITMAAVTYDTKYAGIPQFRVMGQRFVLDSYIFQHMVVPYVGAGRSAPNAPLTLNKRTFPMGLDAMSVLGSQRAYDIADKVYQQTKFANYQEQTEKLRAEVSAYTDRDWTKNVYAGWLHTLRFLLEVKREGYPGFMQSPAWVDKQLNAALGSWAELRHDTILYAKQSVVAECGGEGGEEKPPPPPKGYVEPEVLTYWRLKLLATQLRDGLKQRGFLTDEKLTESFGELISLLKFLEGVSVKELDGVALTKEEFDQIEYYGDALGRLNLYSRRGVAGDEITSMTDKDMGVVADVHTGPIGTEDYALEEGVGHAHEVYVIYPMGGKLLLGRGAVFSYHEFTVRVDQRMTDEQWQAKLLGKDRPKPPPWTKSFLSPVGSKGEKIEFDEIADFTKGGC
jgi:hypothetical protein